MKVFKKILQLLFIYIFVTASVATGYIFLVSPYAGGNGDTQTSASKVMDPVVSKMLSNIMLSDTLGVDLSLNVDMADTGSKTEVSVKGSLSLASLLEGKVPDCAFTIVVKGSTSLNCLITIKNSVLFLETAGVKLQINVNNLISEIPELMKLIGVKFDFEMPNLNIDMLNGMMSGLVSTKNENGGYDIPLDLMGMGTLLFKTDEKSNMKSLNLTNLELGGVKVNLVTDIFENPVVEDTTLLPNDYTNVTPLLGFVGNISQFKDAESIKINASVDMPSGNIPINVILNMKTKEVSATAIYNSNSINLVYAGSILYVKINEYCFSIKSESIVNLVAELKKTISSDNELGNFIMQMVSVIKEKIALPSTSIKDIISNIDIIENGNNYVINILGQEIKVCFENGIMSVITNIQNNEIALSAQKTSENICIDNAKYVPIDEVLDAVPSLLKMVTSKAFSGDISLFISGNKTIKANYYINLSNFSVKLMVNYAGKDISITYIDNELYLDILNMKVKCSMQGIQEIINILKTNNIIKDNDFDITNTLNKLKEYKLLSATRFVGNNFSSLILMLTGSIKIAIDYNAVNISNIYAEMASTEVHASINCHKEQFDLSVNNASYKSSSVLAQYIDNILKFKDEPQLDADIEIKQDNDVVFNSNLQMDMTNNQFSILGLLGGKDIAVSFNKINNEEWIFIQYATLKAKISKASFNGIFATIAKMFKLDPKITSMVNDLSAKNSISEIVKLLTDSIKSSASKININQVLNMFTNAEIIADNSINVILNLSDVLGSDFACVTINLKVVDNYIEVKISGLNLGGKNTEIKLNLSYYKTGNANVNIVKDTDADKIMDLSSLDTFIDATLQTASLKKLNFAGSASVNFVLAGGKENAMKSMPISGYIDFSDIKNLELYLKIDNIPVGYMLGAITQTSEAAENTSLGTSGGGYPKRVAEVFYKNGLINLKRTLEKKVWAWSDVKKIVGYEKAISMQEFNQDPMQYICDLLALTNMIKNSIYDAIKNAPPVDNSINAILPNDAYLYNEKDLSYRIKLNGGNLVGDSNVQEILATIYKNNEGYLYKLGASIKVVNIITIKIDDLIIK